jgi:hypothetical protein
VDSVGRWEGEVDEGEGGFGGGGWEVAWKKEEEGERR